jgi:hypothetical protein
MAPSPYLPLAPCDAFLAAMPDIGRTLRIPAVAPIPPAIHTAGRQLPVAPVPRC